MKNPKEIHKHHRQRMKESYLKAGFESFSDIEKLEFILYFAISQKDTNPIAHALLDEFGRFDKVLEAPVEKLKTVDGIGEHSALLIHLFLDVFASYGKNKCETFISSTSTAKQYAANLFCGKSVEEFYIICLDKSNRVLQTKLINKGTVSEVEIKIREITSTVLNSQCERVILAHNHPNGSVMPSDEDISFTSKIMLVLFPNDVDVIDHIIVGNNKQCSFAEAQLIEGLKQDTARKVPFHKAKKNIGNKEVKYVVN